MVILVSNVQCIVIIPLTPKALGANGHGHLRLGVSPYSRASARLLVLFNSNFLAGV
jgi:hypothetical protein